VDASLVLMLFLPDQHSQRAEALWSQWEREGMVPLGPPLLYAEVPSVLREAVFFGRLSPEEGQSAFETFCDMAITVSARRDLHLRAWELAQEFHRPRLYDSFYLAAAQAEGCELWTADRRLVNAVNRPWVRWVGDYRG
jgi:predicted nucleic acid-binding protein